MSTLAATLQIREIAERVGSSLRTLRYAHPSEQHS